MEALLADLARHGVPLVGLNVFLQQLGLPIPAVPTMMVAGALAADGRMLGGGVFGISVLASVVADTLWFVAGRRYGYPVLRLLCRVSLSPDTCVRQTEGIFERYGFYSLVVSKFVPGFSTVAPPMAGALRMSFGRFLAASIASAALWVGAAMMVGLLFAAQIEALLAWIARHGALAGVAIGAALAGYVTWKAVQRWRLARFVEGTLIEADELQQALSHDEPPLVVDIGSSLAQQSRPHLPGALLIDLDDVASHAFPRDRVLLRMPERGVGQARNADAAGARLPERAPADRRPRWLDRCGVSGRSAGDDERRGRNAPRRVISAIVKVGSGGAPSSRRARTRSRAWFRAWRRSRARRAALRPHLRSFPRDARA